MNRNWLCYFNQFYDFSTGMLKPGSVPCVIDTPQALTVSAGGAIIPIVPTSYIAVASVSGAGGLADDLDTITAGITWTGKLLMVKMAGAGIITVKHSAGSPGINIGVDFIEDSIYDIIILRWIAVDTWEQINRSDNG